MTISYRNNVLNKDTEYITCVLNMNNKCILFHADFLNHMHRHCILKVIESFWTRMLILNALNEWCKCSLLSMTIDFDCIVFVSLIVSTTISYHNSITASNIINYYAISIIVQILVFPERQLCISTLTSFLYKTDI